MSEPVVIVENFRKTYGSFVAVQDISFNIEPGEIFGLLGPNGAGKTTTLESLEGIRKADGGRLRVAGIDPTREPQKLRNKIGVQLQTSGMPTNLRVSEAMQFFCAYHGVPPRYDLLERLGLHDKMNSDYDTLSTGLQRRFSLALAVAHKPSVLFLDEPTAGLDVPSRVELHTLIAELRDSGTTILLATHDMAEAEEMANRVAILLNGKIAAAGTPLEITATGAGLTKITVRTANSSLQSTDQAFPGVSQSASKEDYTIYFTRDIAATVSAIIGCIEKQADSLIDLRVERPSLEDRFLEITRSNGGAQ